jgi:hypothetical protein
MENEYTTIYKHTTFCNAHKSDNGLYHHFTHQGIQVISVHKDDEPIFKRILEKHKYVCQCHTLLPPPMTEFNVITHTKVQHNNILGPFPKGTAHLILLMDEQNPVTKPQTTMWTEREYRIRTRYLV